MRKIEIKDYRWMTLSNGVYVAGGCSAFQKVKNIKEKENNIEIETEGNIIFVIKKRVK